MINQWLKKIITRLINNEPVVSCCPNSCIMLNLSTVKNSCNSLVSSKSELEFWGFLELCHWQWRQGWLFWTHGTFTGGLIFINAKVFLQNYAVSVFYEAKKTVHWWHLLLGVVCALNSLLTAYFGSVYQSPPSCFLMLERFIHENKSLWNCTKLQRWKVLTDGLSFLTQRKHKCFL